MIASYPGRRFQLWEYRVSHGSLLVRSPRTPDAETNIDIVFVGVEFVSAPRHFKGVELDQGVPADVEAAAAALGRDLEPRQVFTLTSEGKRHVVVAAGHQVNEHTGDIFDSPFS